MPAHDSLSRETVEQRILGLGHEVFRAIQHKDADALRRILAEDFVQRSRDGSEAGREQFLAGVASLPVEVVAIRGEHLKVNVFGQVAVMTGVQHAEWRQGDGAEGVSSVAFVDVFALRDTGWLMVLAYGVEL